MFFVSLLNRRCVSATAPQAVAGGAVVYRSRHGRVRTPIAARRRKRTSHAA